MKRYLWMLAGPATLLGLAMPCAAQLPVYDGMQPASLFGRPYQRYCPAPPRLEPPVMPLTPSLPPVDPTKKTPTPKDPSQQQPQQPQQDDFSEQGRYKSTYGQGSAVSAGFGVGASVASGGAGLPVGPGNLRAATVTNTSTPLILPGLLTSAGSQFAVPMDRVFFDYGYFDRYAITSPTGATPGFNLNTFNIGIEKTIFNGLGSVYVSVPFLAATQNVSGQGIDGLGNVNAGFKLLLYQDTCTGSALGAGFTVSAPTGRPARVTTTSALALTFTGDATGAGAGPPVGTILPAGSPLIGPTVTTTVNPTYLQPWIGGLWVSDKLYVHEYLGVIVPTDDRVATILNNNLTIGYQLYRDQTRTFSSFTPTIGAQALIPVNHVSNTAGSTTSQVPVNIDCLITSFPANQLPVNQTFGFPDQLFLSGGAQIGFGERLLFSANVVVPVVGPRGYSIGATFGLNYFY